MRVPGKSDDNLGELRRTQLITTFGPGAIVDMPGCSAIIADAGYWDYEWEQLHEVKLERLLGVKGFKRVKASTDDDKSAPVKAFRFPKMHYCPNCKRLEPIKKLEGAKRGQCGHCRENNILVPSRFVMACPSGHIDDFPYNWWVHVESEKSCTRSGELKIRFSDKTGGLEGIVITCTECGATRSMAGSMGKDALAGLHCQGKRPWLGARFDDPAACEEHPRCLQRGASNVYFPSIASALTIPSLDTTPIDEFAANLWDDWMDEWDELSEEGRLRRCSNKLERKGWSHQYTARQLYEAVERMSGANASTISMGSIVKEEYSALVSPDQDTSFFKTKHVGAPDRFSHWISDVILVKRLREIMALRGFRRVNPADDEIKEGEEAPIMPSNSKDSDWLPAMELLGEGIFITLNEETVSAWSDRMEKRYALMEKRLEKSAVCCSDFSPKFVLLHTLAHLLIRQLTLDCGYSGASIKEKIYSSDTQGFPMAGILLYTASSDSDGSLGGLVRRGYPNNLETTLENMLHSASWCSSDPVCSQSHGQGIDSLNYAACHACTLLPETSCTMRNCLLDRVSVVGEIGDASKGFFAEWFNPHAAACEEELLGSSSIDKSSISLTPLFKNIDYGSDGLRRACEDAAQYAGSEEAKDFVEQLATFGEGALSELPEANVELQEEDESLVMLAWRESKVLLFESCECSSFPKGEEPGMLQITGWDAYVAEEINLADLIERLKR